VGCGLRIGLDGLEELPACPGCGGTGFRRAPLFDAASAIEPDATSAHRVIDLEPRHPNWLSEARRSLAAGERYLAFEDRGAIHTVPLPIGWSRIGRSITSDIRLDDPTVSRRHALVVRSPSGDVRVLDDRSLNGVHVNGDQVEWGPLLDGDELEIGRFRLYLVAVEAGSRLESSLSD
jgi:hypothetical protein